MSKNADTVTINAVIDMPTQALTAIVQNAKHLTGRDAKGVYRVDTADVVSSLISRFLVDRDFHAYVEDLDHYDL